jgi:hypothetical protein
LLLNSLSCPVYPLSIYSKSPDTDPHADPDADPDAECEASDPDSNPMSASGAKSASGKNVPSALPIKALPVAGRKGEEYVASIPPPPTK